MHKSILSRLFKNNLVIVFVVLATLISMMMFLINDYINDSQYESDCKAADNIQFMTEFLQIKNSDYRNYVLYNHMLKQYSDFIESDITVVNGLGAVHASTANISRVPNEYNTRVLSGETIRLRSNFGGVYEKNVLVVGIPIEYNGKTIGGMYFNTRIPDMRRRLNK